MVPEGTTEGATKNSLNDLHKDVQERMFEVAYKAALEITIEGAH